ncbi:MAG: hypothetical protein LBQ83_08085 [Candidatus Margulisbacteria bacterium]|nr:hypothetical protein [Candidatus Margulisiibacteriota bacterium]
MHDYNDIAQTHFRPRTVSNAGKVAILHANDLEIHTLLGHILHKSSSHPALI